MATAAEEIDYQRELQRKGEEISLAMGVHRGREPLVEAVSRMSTQLSDTQIRLEEILAASEGILPILARVCGYVPRDNEEGRAYKRFCLAVSPPE